jgi:hypothetical protein
MSTDKQDKLIKTVAGALIARSVVEEDQKSFEEKDLLMRQKLADLVDIFPIKKKDEAKIKRALTDVLNAVQQLVDATTVLTRDLERGKRFKLDE